MLNLFEKKLLFQLDSNVVIKQAIFSNVNLLPNNCENITPLSSQWVPVNLVPESNLVLYCDDFHIELCQFVSHEKYHRFQIPLDDKKGHVVSMCFDNSGNNILAITSKSIIYQIPLQFILYCDIDTGKERTVIVKEASVIECCTLTPPTSIIWWQRDEAYIIENNSIAIVGDEGGMILFVDLKTKTELRHCYVPFDIISLKIFDEMFMRSLLITCGNSLQYQMMLEHFRSSGKSPYNISTGNNEDTPNTPDSNINWNNYYLSCIFNLPLDKDGEILAKIDQKDSKQSDFLEQPQMIAFNNEIDENLLKDSNKAEFFIFANDLLLPKMLMYPQSSTSSNIFLVKQQSSKVQLDSNNEETSPEKSTTEPFCDVSIKRDPVLELFEISNQDFCIKSILLSSAKFYMVQLFPSEPETIEPKLLRVIDCGYRFIMLAYVDKCILVSKTFAEQNVSASCTSPRLALIKNKRLGSFRRKNPSNQVLKTISIMEEFCFDSDSTNKETVIDVFIISGPGSKYYGIKDFINSRRQQLTDSQNDYLDMLIAQEKQLIDILTQQPIENIMQINEKFLIITSNSVYQISSKEQSFSKYFHSEIENTLNLIESGQNKDGELITLAKLLVECFGTLSLQNNKVTRTSSGTSQLPNQEWQIWLWRSALLLLKNLNKNTMERDFHRIFCLFELTRTSRRRVITSLVYFQYWTRALQQIRKFFETKILLELSDDERFYFTELMFVSLISLYFEHDYSNVQYKNEFYKFFHNYRFYYDSKRMMERLLDHQLMNMAKFVSLLVGDYVTLVDLLLRKFHQLSTENEHLKQKILQLLTSKRVTNSLILSVEYLPSDGVRSIRLIEHYLNFVFSQLPTLSLRYLLRLAVVFDPNRHCLQFLLHQTLNYCNQTYLSSRTSDTNQSNNDYQSSTLLPIKKKDLINLYIFVLSLCLRKLTKSIKFSSLYDYEFLNTIETLSNQLVQSEKIVIAKKALLTNQYKLSSGSHFSIIYTPEKFIIWGNFEYLPCSIHKSEEQPETISTPTRKKYCHTTENKFFSTVIDAPIESVSSGHQHILFLTKYGLFAMGSSSFGQLGLGPKLLETKYPLMLELFDVTFVKVVCGSYHSLAIASDGHLYSWGWAVHGQLGHGSIEDEYFPKLIKFFESKMVVDVAAGYSHTIVLTEANDLFVFGENSYGQLGLQTETIVNKAKFSIPQKFLAFDNQIKMIACGLFHSVVLVADTTANIMKLYCWGLDPTTTDWKVKNVRAAMKKTRRSISKNSMDNVQESNTCILLEDYSRMKIIELDDISKQAKIVKLCAGQSHTLLLTDTGRVYAFGYGRKGQLGLGEEIITATDQVFLIENLENILDIDCGAMHSLAIDNTGTVYGWGKNFSTQSFNDEVFHSNNNQLPPNQLLDYLNKRGHYSNNIGMMVSTQENTSCIPKKFMELNVDKRSFVSRNLELTTLSNANYDDPKVINENILKTLIKFKPILDYRHLLNRFEQFGFLQLCAIVSYSLNDYINSYRYQLNALYNEIELLSTETGELPKSKILNELSRFAKFFIEKCQHQSDSIRQCVVILLESWIQIMAKINLDNCFNFILFLNQIYLDTKSTSLIENPYFGFFLMQSIYIDDSTPTSNHKLRTRLQISDQILIKLVARTETLINISSNRNSEIILFQQLLEQLSKYKLFDEIENCSAQDAIFPYEMLWRKLLQEFDTTVNIETNSDSDLIDIEISNDINLNDLQTLLFVFNCGHSYTISMIREKIVELLSKQTTESSGLYQKLLDELDGYESVDTLRNLVKELSCPTCLKM